MVQTDYNRSICIHENQDCLCCTSVWGLVQDSKQKSSEFLICKEIQTHGD